MAPLPPWKVFAAPQDSSFSEASTSPTSASVAAGNLEALRRNSINEHAWPALPPSSKSRSDSFPSPLAIKSATTTLEPAHNRSVTVASVLNKLQPTIQHSTSASAIQPAVSASTLLLAQHIANELASSSKIFREEITSPTRINPAAPPFQPSSPSVICAAVPITKCAKRSKKEQSAGFTAWSSERSPVTGCLIYRSTPEVLRPEPYRSALPADENDYPDLVRRVNVDSSTDCRDFGMEFASNHHSEGERTPRASGSFSATDTSTTSPTKSSRKRNSINVDFESNLSLGMASALDEAFTAINPDKKSKSGGTQPHQGDKKVVQLRLSDISSVSALQKVVNRNPEGLLELLRASAIETKTTQGINKSLASEVREVQNQLKQKSTELHEIKNQRAKENAMFINLQNMITQLQDIHNGKLTVCFTNFQRLRVETQVANTRLQQIGGPLAQTVVVSTGPGSAIAALDDLFAGAGIGPSQVRQMTQQMVPQEQLQRGRQPNRQQDPQLSTSQSTQAQQQVRVPHHGGRPITRGRHELEPEEKLDPNAIWFNPP